MKINEMIKKWHIELILSDNQESLRAFGKPAADEVAELKRLKPEIIAELKRRKAVAEAALQEELRAIRAGEKEIVLHWHDGEYLTGWEVFGQESILLEKIGLAKYVEGWGYHVALDTAEALGERFTYPQAAEYTRPAREAAEAKRAAAEAARQAKFTEARETGKPVLLRKWMEDCSDPREECSTDIVCEYAMPDGGIKTERQHTW